MVALVLAVAVGGVFAGGVFRDETRSCPVDRTQASSPFLDAAGRREQPDPRLDRLVDAAARWPVGKVRGGVGFDYGQWLSVAALPAGLLVQTKRNRDLTVLDQNLEPRWAVRSRIARVAYDADARSVVVLGLRGRRPTQVTSLAADTGRARWCRTLTSGHQEGAPVATSFASNGDVAVLLPAAASGSDLAVTRLAEATGSRRWAQRLANIGRGAYLTFLPGNRILVGGDEESSLSGQAEGVGATPSGLALLDAGTGKVRWQWRSPSGPAQVLGVVGTEVLIQRNQDGRRVLDWLDLDDGRSTRVVRLEKTVTEVALRGPTILTRSASALAGLSAQTGTSRWQRPISTRTTVFPYGFTLAQVPFWDEDRVLIPTTTSLWLLALQSGEREELELPRDGIRTSFWPYQLATTTDLLAVVTNIGGVVVDRDG